MSEHNKKKYGRYYLESYKRAIVKEVELEKGAIKLICERHDLRRKAVGKWALAYGSAEYLASRQKRRSAVEKNKIIREILSGRCTVSEAQLKYTIDCRDTITCWIREYKKGEQELSVSFSESAGTSELALGLSEMQKELEMARLKIRALEVMVDIASDQFKVDIRKKFGAKQ
jgi:transposase-like protein